MDSLRVRQKLVLTTKSQVPRKKLSLKHHRKRCCTGGVAANVILNFQHFALHRLERRLKGNQAVLQVGTLLVPFLITM